MKTARHGLLAAVVVVVACSSSGTDVTSGKRIVLHTRVVSDADAPFTTAAGWTITLDEAELATGALYYFDGATIFSFLRHIVGIPRAHAHPGHYVAGDARGEMRSPSSVDLRVPVTALADGAGVTGVVRSATFSFGVPPQGPLAAKLGSHVIVLQGKAVKAGVTRVFRAEVDAADVLDAKGAPVIEGCVFREVDVQANGTVTLQVKPSEWLDQVEFDDVAPGGEGAPVILGPGSLARNELVRGIRAGTGYVFSYQGAEE